MAFLSTADVIKYPLIKISPVLSINVCLQVLECVAEERSGIYILNISSTIHVSLSLVYWFFRFRMSLFKTVIDATPNPNI